MRNPEIVLAILAGSALIAAGLYFGLRARPSTPATESVQGRQPPTAPMQSEASATPSATPMAADRGLPTVPANTPAEQQRVEQSVRAKLVELKPVLVKKCWEPSLAKAREPGKVMLSYNGTIGPEGTPLAYGVSQSREAYRVDIQPCVQRELLALKIADAPATPTLVTVEFELP